jgi:ankyrin repeat protein
MEMEDEESGGDGGGAAAEDPMSAAADALIDALQGRQPLETIREMVDAHPGVLSTTDDYGRTPLHYALYYGSALHVVNFLVDRGQKRCRRKRSLANCRCMLPRKRPCGASPTSRS